VKTPRFLGFCLLLSLLLTACVKTDPAPRFVDASYQVRCIDCEPLSPDDSAHALLALDGENGFAISCSSEMRGKSRLLTFSAQSTDKKRASNNYSFKITQADIDSKDPGNSCKIRVSEGANTYEGACTSGDPSDDNPCHLEIAEKNGIVKGNVLCDKIPSVADATVFRYVVKPNTDDQAASFELHGCQL
jgi:hypothetical protein